MKKICFALFLVLTVAFFTSCFNDEGYSLDQFRVDIATVENPHRNNVFFLRLDDNTLLWTAATNFINYRPRDGQRVLVNYTKLWDKKATALYDYDVRLNDVHEVLTKSVFNITPQTQDSIGNDSISVLNMWIGSHFLNVEFTFPGFNRIHFINLVHDVTKVRSDGKIHLEFRHNANNDLPRFNRWGLASFDIRSLQQSGVDSVRLAVQVNVPHRAAHQIYELTYHYGAPSNLPRRPMRQNIFDNNKATFNTNEVLFE